jgi:hypothetical protein
MLTYSPKARLFRHFGANRRIFLLCQVSQRAARARA